MLRNLLLLATLCLALPFVCLAQKINQSQSKVTQSKVYQEIERKVYQEIERLEIEWNTINEVSDAEGKQRMLADDSYHIGGILSQFVRELYRVLHTSFCRNYTLPNSANRILSFPITFLFCLNLGNRSAENKLPNQVFSTRLSFLQTLRFDESGHCQ
jgi:hypothetical protein